MSEPVYKVHATILSDPPAGESNQSLQDDFIDLGTPKDGIEPPENLSALAALTGANGVRRSCIEAVTLNTVGLGYKLTVAEGLERDMGDQSRKIAKATARLEACAARDTRLRKPTFTELIKAVKWDEEEVGNGYMEVSRDRRTGLIDGLFHVPAKRVRRLRDRSGYLLLPPDGDTTRATRFLNFGEKVEYEGGKPQRRLVNRGLGWKRNELIHFSLYTSESRDYGLPRDAALALEYLGDRKAVESNISFFDSSGTPPTVLFVQGEENREGNTINVRVPRETSARIASTLRSDGGHRSRVAVIPLPAGAKAQKETLGEISERDMGFVDFRKDNRSRTMGAFRVASIFIPGADDGGRYTAEVERAITKEQVFDPEQERYEAHLSGSIIRDLGFPDLGITFTDLAVEDDKAKRDSAEKMGEKGRITNREYRAAHGYGPLPEAKEGEEPQPGQVPFGWNDELVEGKSKPADEKTRVAGDDQRGLRPGIGARESRDDGQEKSATGKEPEKVAKHTGPEHVEIHVTEMSNELHDLTVEEIDRSLERTRTVAREIAHEIAQNGAGPEG